MDIFIRHLFATLTYDRVLSSECTWQRTSKDFNRFIQKLRRLHCDTQIAYLRTIESHKDGYPHIHVLLQHPSAVIRVSNSKYFDRTLYQKWKGLWSHGLSDFQAPRRKEDSIKYILKYITKSSTTKTIWKKLYSGHGDLHRSANLAKNPQTTTTPDSYLVEEGQLHVHTVSKRSLLKVNSQDHGQPENRIYFNGIKLCSWSRNFDFSPFFIKPRTAGFTEKNVFLDITASPA